MQRKTKDLILIYICFTVFAIMLIFFTATLYGCHPQEDIQEQQMEIPVIYDSPIENPASHVEVVEQLPDFPSGDEFAAAASFISSYGYDTNIIDLLDHMNYDEENFIECYVGDARTDTGYCFAPALVICMNNYLATDIDTNLRTQNFSGIDFGTFKDYIVDGKPMIVWYTIDGEMPQFEDELYNNYFRRYSSAQVIVVCGIQNGIVAAIDSINGTIEIPEDEFRQVWEACGSQCIGTYYINR